MVGQEVVVRTLGNAISNDEVGHAYLFVGPRGTGKTSVAKILAKALNCPQRKKGEFEPCGKCETCLAIHAAESPDVVELDAASNRGIDDIRDLRERVRYKTVSGDTQVFIIDEVHMLTTEAANALLKTLEEPPENVVFVLCTTEDHKVMPTIRSRCQRFYFQPPTAAALKSVLSKIMKEESIVVDDESVALIIRHANGSFRDALTILEQLSIMFDKKVIYTEASRALGETPETLTWSLMEKILVGDVAEVFRLLERLQSEGQDFTRALNNLYEATHLLVLAQTLGVEELPDELVISEFAKERLMQIASKSTKLTLVLLIKNLESAQAQIKTGGNARTVLTLSLYKTSCGLPVNTEGNESAIDENTLTRLELLEKAIEDVRNQGTSAPQPQYPSAPTEEPKYEETFRLKRDLDVKGIVAEWETLLYELRKLNPVVYAALRSTRPEQSGEEALILWAHDAHLIERYATQISAFLNKHTNIELVVTAKPYMQKEEAKTLIKEDELEAEVVIEEEPDQQNSDSLLNELGATPELEK